MQHKITEPGLLLDPDGSLREPGWSTEHLVVYNRNSVRENKCRLKEWDHYIVSDERFVVTMNICNTGFVGMVAVTITDLAHAESHRVTKLVPMLGTKMVLSMSPDKGVSFCESVGTKVIFEAAPGKRIIDVLVDRFSGQNSFAAHIELDDIPQDSIAVAIPWTQSPTAFFYGQKTLCMRASGAFRVGQLRHEFNPQIALGTLDWGRGVWTYDNRWFWGIAQGYESGHLVGLSLGYGFGDTREGSENALFVDGICHKLDRVDFGIPKTSSGALDYKSRWHMTSNDGRVQLDFTPVVNNSAALNLGIVMNEQNQAYGYLSGNVVLDDGTQLQINNLFASCAVMRNRA